MRRFFAALLASGTAACASAPGVVHWGRAGPKGLRSISSWVKDDSKPMRESVAP